MVGMAVAGGATLALGMPHLIYFTYTVVDHWYPVQFQKNQQYFLVFTLFLLVCSEITL